MYTSPIDVTYREMQMQVEGDIYKAVQKVGVNVDKEELLKALQYDRGQYEQGYKDGYAKAIDDFAKKMSDVAYEDYESDKLIIDYVDVVKIAEEMRCAE